MVLRHVGEAKIGGWLPQSHLMYTYGLIILFMPWSFFIHKINNIKYKHLQSLSQRVALKI